MLKCVLFIFIFLPTFSMALVNAALQSQTKSPEATEKYSAHADFDWDGDGKPDSFDLHVEKKETVNVFEVLQKPVSADEELLRGEIARLSIKGFTAKLLKSALEAIHAPRSFCYRATWREDLRCAVYVPVLKRSILYQNGYK